MKTYKITLFTSSGQAVPYLMMGRARGLQALGHEVQVIDLSELSKKSITPESAQATMQELVDSLKTFNPDAFFFYGATALIPVATAPGKTAPLLSLFDKPMVSFYTCSDLELPTRMKELSQGCAHKKFFVFTYDSFQLHLLRKMGMRDQCALLDLASDPELFCPMGQKAAAEKLIADGMDIPKNGMDISFTANFRDSKGQLPDLDDTFKPELRQTALITAEKVGWHRLRWLEPLEDLSLTIFGLGWAEAYGKMKKNWSTKPFCPYTKLPLIYNASEININITAPEMADSYPTRVFDVMAGGGLLITDRRECAYRLFSPGTDMVLVSGPTDMREQAGKYLIDKERAQEMRYHARKTIMEKHSWKARMSQALEILENRGLL